MRKRDEKLAKTAGTQCKDAEDRPASLAAAVKATYKKQRRPGCGFSLGEMLGAKARQHCETRR